MITVQCEVDSTTRRWEADRSVPSPLDISLKHVVVTYIGITEVGRLLINTKVCEFDSLRSSGL